jgi:hypothetical protein
MKSLLFVLLVALVSSVIVREKVELAPYSVTHSAKTAVYASLAYCGNTCLKTWSCQDSKQIPKL